jgi:methylthioribose-1-phosphate isomerase
MEMTLTTELQGGVPAPVEWLPDGTLRLVDQSRLPTSLVYLDCRTVEELAEAMRALKVRGAPALGVAAAYGLCLASQLSPATTSDRLLADLQAAADHLRHTRPTAVNLGWALDTVLAAASSATESGAIAMREAVCAAARQIDIANQAANESIGKYGAQLLRDGMNVLTHCNTGPLAAGGIGTALGVIYTAHRDGKRLHVWIDETRPVLQGARLTTWELMSWGIPGTLIVDNMAASLMRTGKVDAVLVGADRIAANGDVANKIGTYGLAVLANHHNIPLYVVAPTSTIDTAISRGDEIKIEERQAEEITHHGGTRLAPEGATVYNPAFDVTPAALVTAIVTECGVLEPPYGDSLREAWRAADSAGARRQYQL